MVWQNIDPVQFIWDFRDRIYHVDCKDTSPVAGRPQRGVLGSHLQWADPRRGWDFVSTGRGDVPWEDCFRMLTTIGYDGPISIEWEDAGMDRLHGAPRRLPTFAASFSTRRPMPSTPLSRKRTEQPTQLFMPVCTSTSADLCRFGPAPGRRRRSFAVGTRRLRRRFRYRAPGRYSTTTFAMTTQRDMLLTLRNACDPSRTGGRSCT